MPPAKSSASFPTPLLAVAAALLLVLGLAASILFLAYFHHFETVKVLAGALTSLVATMVGACLAFWFGLLLNQQAAEQRRAEEKLAACQQIAFDLHREFSSDDMLHARTEASRLLTAHPGKNFIELYNQLPESQTRYLFRVSEFYQRLALLVIHNRIDLPLVPPLFGPYFIWWWHDELELKLVAADPLWPDSILLTKLHAWMQEHVKPADYTQWANKSAPTLPATPAHNAV